MADFAVGCISDLHIPIHNQKAIDWALGELKSFGTGQKGSVLVINGDLFEGDAGSAHVEDERNSWSAEDEFNGAYDFLMRVNEDFPDAYKVFLFGNHDDNFINYNPGRLNKKVQSLLDREWRHLKADVLSDWHTINKYTHDTCWNLGQLTFRHGFGVSKSEIEKDVKDYGAEMGLVVFGHTHRPHDLVQMSHGNVLERRWYANTGSLANFSRMHYMDRKRKTSWGAGVLLAECKAPGLKEGRKTYEAPRWKAVVKTQGIMSQNIFDVRLHV